MKKLIVFFACLALCLPFAFSSQEEEYYSHSYARLNYVKGDVYIQRANDLGYEEGVVNLPIVEGDKLGTRDGRAEIHFGHKNYLRINLNSQIDFVRLPREGDDLIDFHLLEGSVYLRVKLLQTEKGIEVHTPDASFYVLNEGLYRIEVSPDNETKLYVIEGEMEAAGEEGSIAVARGEYLMAQEGRFQLMNSNEGDYRGGESFSDWNRSREEFYGRSVYRNYLPNELYEYETELAYYGRWMYERPYGYVWVPNVHTSSWRPYYNGRWAWYPVIGWTWVSYEPWGWAVSHYGRWHWRGGMGWYWIPQHHWGPAWVHWYHGSDYIGWSPLSYWNRPGVILNNRFYGRYSTGHYPMNSWAVTVVRKNQLQARHISKAALGRNSVSRLGKMSLSAKQPGQRYVVNGDRALAGKAKGALNRSSARTVSKGFVSSRALKSSVGRSGTGSRSPSRALSRDGNVSRSSSSRAIKKPSSSTVSRSRSSSSSRSSANSSPARSSSSSKSRTVKRYQSPSSNRAASKSRSTSSSSRSTVTRAKSSTSSSARVSKARSSSSSSTKSSGSKATKSRSTTKTKKKSLGRPVHIPHSRL